MKPRALGVLVALAAASGACRSIIGLDSVTEVSPDASVRHDARPAEATTDTKAKVDARKAGHDARADASDAGAGPSCPLVTPFKVFSTPVVLTNAFVGGNYVYAWIWATANDDTESENAGLVGCLKTGCEGPPATLLSMPNTIDGQIFGAATASDAGLLFSLPAGTADGGLTDAATGAIQTSSFDGAGARAFVQQLHYPYLVASIGTDVYWTDDPTSLNGSDDLFTWSVWHATMTSDGGAPTVLYEGSSGNTFALFVDATNTYALAQDPTSNLGLFVCARTGCGSNPTEVVNNLQFSSAFDDLVGNDSFASDGVYLYHASFAAPGSITRMNITDLTTFKIAGSESYPANIAVDDTYVYWTTSAGEVRRKSKDGKGAVTVMACGLRNAYGLALDGTNAYVVATDPDKTLNTAMFSIPLHADATHAMTVSFYGWNDNSPVGDVIAYPKNEGYPTVHNAAGGTGTYTDPITFAAYSKELTPGTIVYAPFIEKYLVMEDECDECVADWANGKWNIDVWMNSDSTDDASTLSACEDQWTRIATPLEVNPPSGRTVTTAPLFVPATNTCRTTP